MSEPTTEELIEKTLGLGSVNPDLLRIIADRLHSQQSHLNSLLSVIHRDGGQHRNKVGTEQAVADAMEIIPQMRERVEELDAALDRLTRSHLLKVEAMQSIRVHLQCCRDYGLREAIREVVDNAEWLEGEPDFTVVTQFGWDEMYESNQQLKSENEQLREQLETDAVTVRCEGCNEQDALLTQIAELEAENERLKAKISRAIDAARSDRGGFPERTMLHILEHDNAD